MEPAKTKIMLIDGEPVVRRVVTSILEYAGYTVQATDDFKVALEACKEDPPALVLTNVSLPGISGHDAMRLLKASCPGVPVLMVAGMPSEPVIQHWVNEDGFDIFPKPFQASALVAKVQQTLAERQQAKR